MKLLINICSHDGIKSYYNGVGTMTQRYIYMIPKVLNELDIEYDMNLFTPKYNKDSFGYNENVYLKHSKLNNAKIYEVENGSNGEINFGTVDNWKKICINTAKLINNIDTSKYDKVITIANDTTFCCLQNYIKNDDNHIKILILHSSIKIHEVDSAIEDSFSQYNDRLLWEKNGIEYINNNKNCYFGAICDYFKNHMINEYNLNPNKVIDIYNGEIIEPKKEINYSKETITLFEQINKYDSIILSYGRAEEYKNLDKCFELGKELNIMPVVVAQLYYKEQPIKYELLKQREKYGGLLFIDGPFDLPKYILNNFKGNIICLVPSKKEIMGLIINEIRNLNKNNILLVANNIGGLSEQIENGKDGVLIDTNNIKQSKEEILKYFNKNDIIRMKVNSYKKLIDKYDFNKIIKKFILEIIGE